MEDGMKGLGFLIFITIGIRKANVRTMSVPIYSTKTSRWFLDRHVTDTLHTSHTVHVHQQYKSVQHNEDKQL